MYLLYFFIIYNVYICRFLIKMLKILLLFVDKVIMNYISLYIFFEYFKMIIWINKRKGID